MSKPQLVRRLGFVSATAIVVSNMIGTGIFTTSGFLAGDLGSPTLVIGIWFVGARGRNLHALDSELHSDRVCHCSAVGRLDEKDLSAFGRWRARHLAFLLTTGGKRQGEKGGSDGRLHCGAPWRGLLWTALNASA